MLNVIYHLQCREQKRGRKRRIREDKMFAREFLFTGIPLVRQKHVIW
jgi:hypothetical protein